MEIITINDCSCGREAEFDYDSKGKSRIYCEHCRKSTVYYSEFAKAVEMWNRRNDNG